MSPAGDFITQPFLGVPSHHLNEAGRVDWVAGLNKADPFDDSEPRKRSTQSLWSNLGSGRENITLNQNDHPGVGRFHLSNLAKQTLVENASNEVMCGFALNDHFG